MKYFVDAGGQYLGGFKGVKPPRGAVEIKDAPEQSSDVLRGGVWDTSARPVEPETDVEAAIKLLAEGHPKRALILGKIKKTKRRK